MQEKPGSAPRTYPAPIQDWFSVAISIGHDRTVRLVLELDGRIDHPRLARAVRLLLVEEPILGCRFVPGIMRARWQAREDLDDAVPCTLTISSRVREDLHAFMAERMDPEQDPLLDIRVFRGAADTVCIKLSHAAMDGGGFRKLVYRLVEIYRRLGAEPSFTTTEGTVADRGLAQVLGLFPLRARLKAFATQPFHKKKWGFPFTRYATAESTFSVRTVKVATSRLRDRARAMGVSLTDLIVTSFVRALFEVTDPPAGVPIPFMLPVDLRRYMPSPETSRMCNLTSLAWITLARKPGVPFAETLAEVHRELGAFMDDNPGLGIAVSLKILSTLGYGGFKLVSGIRARMARRQGREFPALSNIGTLDPESLDFGDAATVQAQFFQPVAYPPTFGIVSGSYADIPYFTVAYSAAAVKGDIMERYLDRMAGELEAFC